MKTIIEPFRIKSVESIRISSAPQRLAVLQECAYNLFRIPARDVIVDLLTDSGTGAMSANQWAGVMHGDESYAGAESFHRFLKTITTLTGFSNVLPTHQGRASERILFEAMIGPPPAGEGRIVVANAHFDTTRANIEHTGAQAIDLLPAESRNPAHVGPFKGDIDIEALERVINQSGRDRVIAVLMTVTCNSNGGQPVSLTNLRAVRELCDRCRVPLILDAARFAENAWFIKQRDPAASEYSVRQIARAMFGLADAVTISAKKDGLVNIGGVLLVRDHDLFRRASELLILTEGFITYGGLAGRDLEAMAIGFDEVLDEDYLRYRVRSVEYLGEKLVAAGVPIVQPPGGHAIYIDAAAFCPHIPRSNYPGQALACALYVHGGVRSCEIGSVMMGENAPNELVRLAIPRRTYTQSHIDYVAETAIEVRARAAEIQGMRIVKQSRSLRHFTAEFEPVEPDAAGSSSCRTGCGGANNAQRGAGNSGDATTMGRCVHAEKSVSQGTKP